MTNETKNIDVLPSDNFVMRAEGFVYYLQFRGQKHRAVNQAEVTGWFDGGFDKRGFCDVVVSNYEAFSSLRDWGYNVTPKSVVQAAKEDYMNGYSR